MARRGQNGALYFAKPETNISMLNNMNTSFSSGTVQNDTDDGEISSMENPSLFINDNGDTVSVDANGDVVVHETAQERNERICKLGWEFACVTSADRSSSAETSDVSDRCNPDAQIVTKITNEFTGTMFKKRDANGAYPQWLKDMRNCFKNCQEIYVLMLDRPLTEIGPNFEVDGWWAIGLITEFSETQPLNEGIEISFTIVPSGQTTLYNNDCITCGGDAITAGTGS